MIHRFYSLGDIEEFSTVIRREKKNFLGYKSA